MSRAPFWLRLASLAIDVVLFTLLQALAGVAAYVALGHFPQWVAPLVGIAYLAGDVFPGGTLGKLILGLRVRRADGGDAEPARRVLRWSTKCFGMIAGLLAVTVAYGPLTYVGSLVNLVLMIGMLKAADEDRLAWHDQWSGTGVFRGVRTASGPSAGTSTPASAAPPRTPPRTTG